MPASHRCRPAGPGLLVRAAQGNAAAPGWRRRGTAVQGMWIRLVGDLDDALVVGAQAARGGAVVDRGLAERDTLAERVLGRRDGDRHRLDVAGAADRREAGAAGDVVAH